MKKVGSAAFFYIWFCVSNILSSFEKEIHGEVAPVASQSASTTQKFMTQRQKHGISIQSNEADEEVRGSLFSFALSSSIIMKLCKFLLLSVFRAALVLAQKSSSDYYGLYSSLQNFVSNSSLPGLVPQLVRMSFHDVVDFNDANSAQAGGKKI